MDQKWSCEVCGKSGSVTVETKEDIESVVHKIRDSHSAVSPNCANPVACIRVENTFLE